MRKIYPKILSEFSAQRLEEIIRFGKYNIRGFRIGSKNTLQKRKAMEKELLDASNLSMTLKRYTEFLMKDKKIDNLWTFPVTLEIDTVEEMIKKRTSEIVYLELLSNEKDALLKELLKVEEIDDQSSNEIKTYDEDIGVLRSIIVNFENENNKLKNNNLEMIVEQNKINSKLKSAEEMNGRQKEREDKLNESLLKYKKDIRDYEIKVNELKDIIKYYKEKKEKLTWKIERVSKFTVLIVGGEKTKDWFEYMNTNQVFNLIFEVNGLDQLNDPSLKVDEIWIINHLLPSSEIEKIERKELFLKLKNINRIRSFNDFNEIKNCMVQLEGLYYVK